MAKQKSFLDDLEDLMGNEEVKAPKYIEPEDVEFEGEAIRLNGKDYIVSSLSLRQFKRFQTKLAEFETFSDVEKLDFMIFLIVKCLQKNYPDLSKDWFEDNITPTRLPIIFSYVISGFTEEQLDEKKD